jgi:glycosyltransferase involved in cell wall biosynthesis
MFRKVYGDACVPWFAGIDTEAWPDLSERPKSIDVLIYDKIRWGHGVMSRRLIEPIIAALQARGRSWQIITYKDYDHTVFRDRLAAARSMLFLCEHETQGLAYQEAMASNVPILAWDPGWWIDPQWAAFETAPVPATSVPFFSPECGARFQMPDDFAPAFDRFWAGLPRYRPRAYVERALSLKTSGALYLKYYRQIQEQVAAAA